MKYIKIFEEFDDNLDDIEGLDNNSVDVEDINRIVGEWFDELLDEPEGPIGLSDYTLSDTGMSYRIDTRGEHLGNGFINNIHFLSILNDKLPDGYEASHDPLAGELIIEI